MSSPLDPIVAVSQRLDIFLSAQRAEVADMGADAERFVDQASDTLRGGKRLRARFCMTGWRAVEDAGTGAPAALTEAAVAVASALEIFHAAALVHDDIIDNSDTRRGRPAAHRALEALHRDGGWHGRAPEFGRSSAILLGDLLVAWSDDLLEEGLAHVDPARARAVRTEYARMRRDVTVGQYLDIAEESAFVVHPGEEHAARALRVASYKSARYSIQQPLLIGAALAGADDAQLRALADFGHPVGMAFQLRDDVLGVFGDAEVTGKPSGDDLREGKRTVLIAYAREAMSPAARRILDELLGDSGLDGDQIAALQTTIIDSGARDRVEELISSYAREADRALSGARLDNASVSQLRDLARAATQRAA